MHKVLTRLSIWLLGALLVVAAPVTFAQQAELSASLQSSDNGVLFVLRNNTADTLSVLRWETPLESELTQDVFDVVSSNYANRARYSGRLIKRGKPEPQDYLRIKAGESVSAVVSLAEYYQIAGDGQHNVSFNGEFEVHKQASNKSILSSRTASKVVNISTRPVAVNLVAVPERAFARVGGYNSCSADQQAQLPADLNASEVITRDARVALSSLPVNERASSPRYLHWFGEYSAARYSTVLDIYQKAEQVMGDGSIQFNCNCDDQVFAYVFPIDPFKVYLCNLYWTAPQTGTDSRAGTILHELSHFPEVGDTDDNAYGAVSAANLARSDPASAVNNADSVEYFAENTPFRAISNGTGTPTPAVQYSPLQLGVAASQSVSESDSVYYQVSGADFVELTTLEGDADLYIYSSAARDNELCQRNSTGSTDRCEVASTSTVYIAVVGYASSRYSIVAGRSATSINSEVLSPGNAQTRSVAANQSQYFTVTGANSVEITSSVGDADLYVYSNDSRNESAVICSSRNNSADSVVDACPLDGSTVFVTVFGFTDTQYVIAASAPVVSEDPVVQPQSLPNDSGGGGKFSLWFAMALTMLLMLRRRKVMLPLRRLGVMK